jgi:16S rRNA (cytosine1402-N4)-methyltransferase
MQNHHIPVLLNEVKDYLLVQNTTLIKSQNPENINFFDGTLGGGGYTKMILDFDPNIVVTASDLDSLAIDNFWDFTGLQKENETNRVKFIHSSFLEAIENQEDNSFNGIVLDLGFSSNQMELGGRGFAYSTKDTAEPFDLRFDVSQGISVVEKIRLLKTSKELGNLIYNYSGESLARKIGTDLYDFIQISEKNKNITVGEVLEVITKSIPKKFFLKQNSILSRIWQSLRIWVNDELDQLSAFLPVAFEKLKVGGRLVIVDFHSLEDKIVTHWMRQMADPIGENKFGEKKYQAKLITKKGVEPSEAEVLENPRCRSAKLRCLERII